MKKYNLLIACVALTVTSLATANTTSDLLAYNSSPSVSSSNLVLAQGPVHPKGTFVFNPKTHTWVAYDASGSVVNSGKASGGKNYCPDVKRGCHTPVGSFAVYSKGSAACKSSKYPIGKAGAPMPYCMFFKGGYAIHGSYDVPNYNASHGCIRVIPSAAKWLSNNFIQNGTRVIVMSY